MNDASIELAVVFRQAPHGQASGREALDLLLLAASYELTCAALFVGDGVYQLVKDQQVARIEAKDYIATFKALPLYDVEQVRVCAQSLADRGLTRDDLLIEVEPTKPEQIQALLGASQQVLTF
ncbi:sulfurtransferase complex subunit TusC [Ferrimonas balearica]|uniref:sulfurtransferase complex subunit TusC n=1 Tax=Ferrimonas balearica TaxID=44012 RepID=UPI001C995CA9|nr:sulfurtransferase complex subunit TusC [Ferrimonas balearica]MBY5991524.1 sulfurtransferase complex subunit TusC [Ferrimonas balearica]